VFNVYFLSVGLQELSHPAVFASNVQCVCLAAGRRTLKYVLTEVGCFQFLLLRHWYFKGSGATQLKSLVIVLLQIFSWFSQWKQFENWSVFDEVISVQESVPNFLGHPVHCTPLSFHIETVNRPYRLTSSDEWNSVFS